MFEFANDRVGQRVGAAARHPVVFFGRMSADVVQRCCARRTSVAFEHADHGRDDVGVPLGSRMLSEDLERSPPARTVDSFVVGFDQRSDVVMDPIMGPAPNRRRPRPESEQGVD